MKLCSTIYACMEAKGQHELLSMFFEIQSLNQERPVSATEWPWNPWNLHVSAFTPQDCGHRHTLLHSALKQVAWDQNSWSHACGS